MYECETMLLEEAADDAALTLTDRHYRQLRLGVETYRQELVLRLGAEVGLRPAEMTRIRPADVTTHERGGQIHHFVDVPDEDGESDRQAYLPDDVENDLRKYVRAEDIADDERVLPVTPRRVQMLVSEIVSRTAERTGNERFETVSSRSLRRYFARQLLDEEGVHPKVVQAIGGWERLASLEPYLSAPDRNDVASAFEGTTLSARGGHVLDEGTLADVVEGCGHAVYVTDSEGAIEYVNRRFEEITGYAAGDAIGRSAQALVADGDETAACWEDLDDGEVYESDVTALRDGGEEYQVHQTIAPITGRDGTRRFVAVAEERSSGSGGTAVSARFDAVLERYRAVGAELVESSMRREIEQGTCERLADGDAYDFAWAGKRSGQELLTCASAGIDDDAVDRLATASGATATALETESVVATTDVTDDPEFETWADHAREAGYQAAAVVPVTDGDTTYGVVNLGTTDADAFDERERGLLEDLGNRIGQALTAAERRKLLLADTVVELEFKSTDDGSFFVAASQEFGCTFTLEGVVPGEEGSLLYFVVLEDADDEAVLQWVNDRDCIADVRLVRDYGDEALLEFVVTDSEASKLLTEQGGTVQEMTVEDGVQTFVGAMPSDADVRETVYTLTDAFPDTELLTKHEREKSIETAAAFRSSLQNALTEKQAAVIQAAHHAGYFEWPRGSTAEELADSMGITSPTLHNHLRRGLQKLLVTFFEEQEQQLLGDETPWADT